MAWNAPSCPAPEGLRENIEYQHELISTGTIVLNQLKHYL
jgi:hypothetical protein